MHNSLSVFHWCTIHYLYFIDAQFTICVSIHFADCPLNYDSPSSNRNCTQEDCASEDQFRKDMCCKTCSNSFRCRQEPSSASATSVLDYNRTRAIYSCSTSNHKVRLGSTASIRCRNGQWRSPAPECEAGKWKEFAMRGSFTFTFIKQTFKLDNVNCQSSGLVANLHRPYWKFCIIQFLNFVL